MSRIIACPASVALSQHVPAPPSSIYAATGTVAHKLAEQHILTGEAPVHRLGETYVVDGHTVAVTGELVNAVAVYTQEVARITAGADWWRAETRVCLDPYWRTEKPPISAFGTADTLAYHRKSRHLDVLDYKHGSGVFVEVENNPQLLYYAAGALLIVPGPVATVRLTVVQPRVPGQDKVRRWETSAIDVQMWVDDVLIPAVDRAFDPFATMSAGKHCRFCPVAAAKSCPALEQAANARARDEFAGFANLVP